MLSKVTYLGDLRTSSVHIQSGEVILTDAPIDNHGKGQAFSPTDMVTNSTASCMFTIMAIKANEMELNLEGSTAEVFKEMKSNPRMISKITIRFSMSIIVDQKQQIILERVALTCPVYLSLHPDIVKDIDFQWK
ncbi:OsmC family protein [Myroides guanonis]|uniref:Uncharacterized OsmC-related protein n=1 Tax=Myroides guanonis TaxID=1150112 RepID=A0A1I3R783_9FLAO|nr:OsmC family protein [Myroides guanonis]SFJ41642.1 Uncharacterized OsmC-related protein [Myroides guanonis]